MKIAPTSTLKIEPLVALFLFLLSSCSPSPQSEKAPLPENTPFLYVLGIAQDAGYPQAGQQKEWQLLKEKKAAPQNAVALGLVDPSTHERWLFEATPDFKIQLQMMDEISSTTQYPYDGIFVSHAHMGHYTGLMHLGREVMGTHSIPVHALPRMKEFLETNGPWSQLVDVGNIKLQPAYDSISYTTKGKITITPFTVPHRDEFSETAWYSIEANGKTAVFIPDIDKWEKWDVDIQEVIKKVDIAFLDASFFKNGEIPGRDMSEIPHPFVEESMSLFSGLSAEDKAKVHFIHLNHTNPLLFSNTEAYKTVQDAGFHVAKEGDIFSF